MKIRIMNITFTILFVTFFVLISKFYAGYFIDALHDRVALFSKEKGFALNECQFWTNDVREFDLAGDEKAEQIPVLLYHRIIDDEDINEIHFDEDKRLYDTIVLSSQFNKQMQLLHEHQYTTLNSKEFLLFMEGKLDVPKKSILLTFDDGFKDNYMEAYPVLKSYDLNAILFLVTGWVSIRNQSYRPDQTQYLSVFELETMCSVFEFQSHTYNMHYLTKEETAYLIDQSEEKVYTDIQASITNLDNASRSFAYPYGVYNDSNIEQLQKLGVRMAFTTEYKVASREAYLYEIPRLTIFPYDTLADFKSKIGWDEKNR